MGKHCRKYFGTGISSAMEYHLTENHRHLMFKCHLKNCCEQEDYYGYLPNENRLEPRYFVEWKGLLDHISIHLSTDSSEVSRSKFHTKRLDLRKATCVQCDFMFLCQGIFQIQKHVTLQHNGNEYSIRLGCRICMYETKIFEEWYGHFRDDFKTCIDNLNKSTITTTTDIRRSYSKRDGKTIEKKNKIGHESQEDSNGIEIIECVNPKRKNNCSHESIIYIDSN